MTEQTGEAGAPRDVWMRWIIGWHLAFWAVLGLGLLNLALDDKLGRVPRLVAAGLLLALGAAYTVLLQRTTRMVGWRSRTYLIVVVVVTGTVCAIKPDLSLMLFIVYPQVWLFSASVREGIGFTFAVSGATFSGFLTNYGWTLQTLHDVGPTVLVSLLFSVVLGLWLSRVIDQSRERAQLLTQIEATRAELAESHHAQGVMAERERLAREIHDTLAQGFTSIIMHAQAARGSLTRQPPHPADAESHLDTVEEMARENLAEARALVAAFTPAALDGATLTDAVRRLADRFGQQTDTTTVVDIEGVSGALSRPQEVVVLRAVQEALANVRRHAKAGRVTVRLAADDTEVRVEIGDDGVGFTPQEVTSGFGLSGMRSRTAEVGGELEIASSPGGGTRVRLRIPVAADGPSAGDVRKGER